MGSSVPYAGVPGKVEELSIPVDQDLLRSQGISRSPHRTGRGVTPNWLSATGRSLPQDHRSGGSSRPGRGAGTRCCSRRSVVGAEVAGLALWAFVDGVDLGGLGGAGCCPPAAPGGLAAGVGAPTAASDGGEVGAALPAHCRRGIVTHAGHEGFRSAHRRRGSVTHAWSRGVLFCVGWLAGRCEMPGMSRCFTRP